jgi:hypothetical protein
MGLNFQKTIKSMNCLIPRVPDDGRSVVRASPGGLYRLPDIWTTIALAGVHLELFPPPVSPAAAPTAAEVRTWSIARPVTPAGRKRKHSKRTMFTDSQRQILVDWLKMHQANPYPTTTEKEILMQETGLHRDQINVWFANHRIRQGFTASHRMSTQHTIVSPLRAESVSSVPIEDHFTSCHRSL